MVQSYLPILLYDATVCGRNHTRQMKVEMLSSNFNKCRETIASALNDYCTRWCKREHVESNALNNWKLKIFKIIDERVLFYSNNLDLFPP